MAGTVTATSLGLLAAVLAACSNTSATPAQDGGGAVDAPGPPSDAGPTDASDAAPADASDAASVDAADAAPIRTATTRGMLPTAVDNVLVDPFVTSDTAAYHFRAVAPLSAPDASIQQCGALDRVFLSFSPVGVSAPALLWSPTSGCSIVLAPFEGGNGSDTFAAQVWMTVLDGNGNPQPLPAASDLDAVVTVSLLPNSLPSQPASQAFVLTLTSAAPLTLADGTQWGLLALAAPASLPMGGWFSIQFGTAGDTIELAAPQIVPATAVALEQPRRRSVTDADRAAIQQYTWLVKNRPRPRPQRR